MTTFKDVATARRNLWYRIDRYLAGLEKRAHQPGRREGDHLLRALDHLEAGTYAEVERNMMWAEVAIWQLDGREPHPAASPQDLRNRFAAIRRGGVGRTTAGPAVSALLGGALRWQHRPNRAAAFLGR